MNNVRCSNQELYRIIVMLLIVAHHYMVYSGMVEVMAVLAVLCGMFIDRLDKAVREIHSIGYGEKHKQDNS